MRCAWESGLKVRKCIGFDATEDHRTFASSAGGQDICPAEGLPRFQERYDVDYPLRHWELTRKDCIKIIADAGLPVPPKSACFFCPAMKKIEIMQLRTEDPELYALAIEMERLYREGPHFRGDHTMMLKAVHKETGEQIETMVKARTKALARSQFRWKHNDVQQPYKYKLSVSPAVCGLGRDFAWAHLEGSVF